MKVSCVVPAYNEEKRISSVLSLLVSFSLIDEVIVVDDGSADQTSIIVKNNFPQVRLVTLPQNQGKANALLKGAEVAKYPILFFCDADLIGLKDYHLKGLIEPVIEKKTRMIIGAQEYMNPFHEKRWYRKLFPNKDVRLKMNNESKVDEFVLGLGGEKVLYKSDFIKIPNLKDSHYAVEHRIIDYFKENKLPFDYFVLEGVGHSSKIEKWGVKGILKDLIANLTFVFQYLQRSFNSISRNK